jgi:hypothetical protein
MVQRFDEAVLLVALARSIVFPKSMLRLVRAAGTQDSPLLIADVMASLTGRNSGNAAGELRAVINGGAVSSDVEIGGVGGGAGVECGELMTTRSSVWEGGMSNSVGEQFELRVFGEICKETAGRCIEGMMAEILR